HQGAEITYLEIPQLVSPGYVLTKDFLLLATDKGGLVRSLDIAAGKVAPLDKNARFLDAKRQLSEKSNSLFFVDGNKAADALERAVSMVSSLNPALQKAQQEGSGPLQILELLRVAPLAAGESVNENNRVTSRLFVALADVPKTSKPVSAPPSGLPPGLLALLNPQAAPAAEDKPGEPATASPGKAGEKSAGQRDPFRPVILPERVRKAQERPVIPQTPLQRYDLESLKLVGILWGELGNKALIQAPDGKGYTVTANTLIGSRGGVIKEIQADRIIVEESRQDEFGKFHPVNVTVPLRREGGAVTTAPANR
ncbi:MAG: pilus assembly protein PilP, partial [Candidatus Tectomicrobia bacterium]|nr:pilus assembly protein PilP [Candidatus Tectomicrobia bacterium]